MKITPSTPDVAIPLAAYIKRHYGPARSWSRDALLRWVRWNLGEGFLGYALDDERIVGAGIARPVMRPANGGVDCEFDPEGPCLFVDLAISTAPGALVCLVALMRRRFGFRARVAWFRGSRQRLVAHSFLKLHRRIFAPQPATA